MCNNHISNKLYNCEIDIKKIHIIPFLTIQWLKFKETKENLEIF